LNDPIELRVGRLVFDELLNRCGEVDRGRRRYLQIIGTAAESFAELAGNGRQKVGEANTVGG